MERELSSGVARGEISETEKFKCLKAMDVEHVREREALEAKSNAVAQDQEHKLHKEINEQLAVATRESQRDALKKVV